MNSWISMLQDAAEMFLFLAVELSLLFIVISAGVSLIRQKVPDGTVAKLAMRQPFVLFKGLTFQKLCLPGAFRPGDHHNK
ncbi:hypothetical protein ACLEV9_19465, partial [Escherichia coli]